MNKRLVCASVAATILATAGCSKAPAKKSSDPGQAAVAAYADLLTSHHGDLLIARGVPERTLQSPRTYRVTFTVQRPTWLTTSPRFAGDEETTAQNLRITEAWTKLFCTNELNAAARAQGIYMVVGAIVDERGRGHSHAMCMSSTVQKSITDRSRILAAD
jgi:hypothetical protein